MDKNTIKKFRLSMGLTQLALADLIGCIDTCIGRWENGHTKPQRCFRIRLEELMKERNFDPNA